MTAAACTVPAARSELDEVVHVRCADPGDRPGWVADRTYLCAVCREPVSSDDAAGTCALYMRSWPGKPESVAQVRAWLIAGLAGCALAEDLVLCGDELASNAVKWSSSSLPHGRFESWLVVAPGMCACVEIRDSGGISTQPVVRHPAPGAVGGRGLEIVEALSAAWGTDDSDPQWRRVWAWFDWPSPAAAAAEHDEDQDASRPALHLTGSRS